LARATTMRSMMLLLCSSLAVVRSDDGESCSCGRIVALESALAELKSKVDALVGERSQADEAKLNKELLRTVQHEVRASGHASAQPAARQLQMDSGGKTYTATRSWQLHEFPSGHTCNGPGKAYLKPKMAAEGMTPLDYPTTTSTELKLMSNVDGQSRTVIQSMPCPFKVVHDSSCSSAPTLDLQLSTTVQTLSVNNVDIGASTTNLLNSVAALQAAAPSGNEVRFFTSGSCPSGWVDASSQLGVGGKALMIGSSSNPPGSSQTNMGIQVASTQAGHQHYFCREERCAVGDWTQPAGASTANGNAVTADLITTTTTAPTGHYLLMCVKIAVG